MDDVLIYSLPNSKGLYEIFSVVSEIGSELGMYPEEIKLKDGRRIVYNRKDAKELKSGTMSEENYIERNKL